MTRRKAPLQVNQFTGGLNTDAPPLNFPITDSYDELNMDMEPDGTRSKRLGFDFEDSYVEIDSTIPYDASQNLGRSMHKWQNAGGNPEKSILVTQIGNSIHMFDLDSSPISGDKIFSQTYSASTYSKSYSFTDIDGLLVMANGEKEVYVFEYEEGVVTETTSNLYIRDLFGVEDIEEGDDLLSGQYIDKRPDTLTSAHTYNLRNSTFRGPRIRTNTENLEDPIISFRSQGSLNYYPSNADDVNLHLLADPTDSNNRTIERYFSNNAVRQPPYKTRAPFGAFIIDALERGESRLEEEQNLRNTYAELVAMVTTLPVDRTPGGASVVEEYAGHVFYAGFSGDVEGGDSKSPKMSSYVLFSLLVKDTGDINKCYQQSDPTSKEDSAIVATDGGFLRIQSAFNIQQLVSFNNSLFVFAENGVWRVYGNDESGFSATGYQVEKVSNRGCESANSVIVAEASLIYWGKDSIYSISQNEFGGWFSTNILRDKTQQMYLDIPALQKEDVTGFYDSYKEQIRWIYTDLSDTTSVSEELKINVKFGAFTKNRVDILSSNLPKVAGVSSTEPYTVGSESFVVTSQGVDVTDSGVDVTVTDEVRSSSLSEAVYLVITDVDTTINFSFGFFDDITFYDWASDTDTDYDAYLQTGFLTLGEPRSRKQANTVTVLLKRTETGVDGSLDPENESSCLIRGKFGWTDDIVSKKWSTQRQAYRYKDLYLAGSGDDLETGKLIISTRNRIRGTGDSLALRFDAEAGKNMSLYGWAYDMTASSEE